MWTNKWLKATFLCVVIWIFVFSLVVKCHAWPDKWTIDDTVGQTLMTGVLLEDWAQTYYVASHNWELKGVQYHETNVFLGKHPSKGQVNTYMALSAVGELAVSISLPEVWHVFGMDVPARNLWQGGGVVFEAVVVGHNCSVGIGWRW